MPSYQLVRSGPAAGESSRSSGHSELGFGIFCNILEAKNKAMIIIILPC